MKTLHPAVHGGILARRSRGDDMETLGKHKIVPIDLVVVNLYPFVQAAARPDIGFAELVEEIDIGGPSMVRSAAKNFQDVLVVVDPADYERVLARAAAARRALARDPLRACAGRRSPIRLHTTRRSRARSPSSMRRWTAAPPSPVRAERSITPPRLSLALRKIKELRYGENPHQPAAWYALDHEFGLGAAEVLQGKELSFTNLLDLDSAARIALEFAEPAAAVIKHTNPCGAAIGATIDEAYVRARDADSLAAFGGIIGLNRVIDAATARALVSTFIEAVVAPGVEDEARPILATKPNMRVVVADLTPGAEPASRRDVRSILGAVLVQQRDEVDEARLPWNAGETAKSGLESRDDARSERRANGARSALRGASART